MPYKSLEQRRKASRESKRRQRAKPKGKPPTTSSGTIDFLSSLIVSQGQGVGAPLVLWEWQRRFIAELEATGVLQAALTIARGGGKTTLAAALGVAALVGPWAQPRSEVVIVGANFSQARIAYRHALAFMEKWIVAEPERWRILDSEHSATIEDRETKTVLKALAAKPGTLHGLAPSLVIADEGGQWERAQAAPIWAALKTSLGKVPGSKLIAIGTRPVDSEHWFSRLLRGGPGVSATVYAADADDDPFDRATWRKANPSLAHMPHLEAAVAIEAQQAAADAQELANFRAYRLNLGVDDSTVARLVDLDTWKACECEPAFLPKAEGKYVLGLDMAGGEAQAAAAAYHPASGRLEAVAAFPRLPSLEARGRNDGVGSLYLEMNRQGELLQLGERVVAADELIGVALGKWGAPSAVIADRFHGREVQQAVEAAGLRCPLIFSGMGYVDGAPRVRDFRRAAASGRIIAGRSLLLRSALSEARVIGDTSGNFKLAKAGDKGSGRRTKARDDAAAAALLAVSEGYRHYMNAPRKPRRWAVV